jgi:hypothetical protein
MKAKFIIVGMGLLCLLHGQRAQAELFNDGGVHDIISGTYGRIIVDNPAPLAPAYTTVNFGGTAFAGTLEAFSRSRVTVNGGGPPEMCISAHDNSRVTVNSRSLNSTLGAYDNSRVTVNDGSFNGGGVAYNNSQVTVNGGRFEWFDGRDDSQATWNGGSSTQSFFGGNSQVTMNGGFVQMDFVAYDDSRVTINGGLIQDHFAAGGDSRATITGGQFWGYFDVYDNSRVTLYGSDFAIYRDTAWGLELVFSGYGDLAGPFGFSDTCWLFGTLANGDHLGAPLSISDGAVVSFVPLPGAALLGMIGLAYAGCRLRR